MTVTTTFNDYLETEYLSEEPYLGGNAEAALKMQFTVVNADNENNLKMQFNSQFQIDRLKMQFDTEIVDFTSPTKMQFIISDLFVRNCAGYLEADYLSDNYLTGVLCAGLRMQFQTIASNNLKMQEQFVIYNTTNLRIMCDFPSRGAAVAGGTNAWGNTLGTGNNWRIESGGSPVSAAGDFEPKNLNTDIVEQVWRSDGTLSGINIDCDTEIAQGVTIDTLAILNHNLTSSATIVLQGADVDDFSTIGTEILTISITDPNIYYIAETFPPSSSQHRYWRFVVNDPTNTNGYLEIGTIIFGSATIFQGECFVDRLVRTNKHFSDKVRTEGFTNVSNDRALKHGLKLQFKNLKFGEGNYNKLIDIFEDARTSLKCLWIPMPTKPTRFTIFGKLIRLPNETHNVKGDANDDLDFVDLSIEVDESF